MTGMILKKNPYKLTTKHHTPKQYSSPKRALMYVRSDLSMLKYHGKLEKPVDCVTDYDKEEFIQAVK